jgi:hypothetical protein
MGDLIGLTFFILLIIGVFVSVKLLANPKKRTVEDFERGVEEGSGLAGAGMNALQKVLQPEAAKGIEVVMELKNGRYNKKKQDGKASGNINDERQRTGNDD